MARQLRAQYPAMIDAPVNAAGNSESPRCEPGPLAARFRETEPRAQANPARFSTQYQDDATDLLYCGYRYYNASTGRWPNRDPISELGFKRANGYALRKRRDEANPYTFVVNRPIDSWDVLGLYGAGGATGGEIIDIITEIGPIDAASIKDTPGEAMKCASSMPRKSLWGGEGDAVRHCTWLCLMSKKIGMKQALAVAGIHEKHHPPPTVPKPPKGYSSVEDWSKADTEMDNANNAYGAQLGSACGLKDCCSACNQALKQGQLKVNQPGGYDFGP